MGQAKIKSIRRNGHMPKTEERIRELERENEELDETVNEIKKLDDEEVIDLPDLTDEELGLPKANELELVAMECLQHKRNIVSIRLNLAANRRRGQPEETTRLEKLEDVALDALKLIKRDYGTAPFKLANEIAEMQTAQMKERRTEEKRRLAGG